MENSAGITTLLEHKKRGNWSCFIQKCATPSRSDNRKLLIFHCSYQLSKDVKILLQKRLPTHEYSMGNKEVCREGLKCYKTMGHCNRRSSINLLCLKFWVELHLASLFQNLLLCDKIFQPRKRIPIRKNLESEKVF